MRKVMFLLTMFSLLGVGLAQGASVTDNPSNLVFGTVWMEGCLRASLVQRLHVSVTNTGSQNYAGYWRMYDTASGEDLRYSQVGFIPGNFSEMNVPAGETAVVTMYFLFTNAGHYDFYAASPDYPDKHLFSFSVDIAEFQEPRLKATIRVDMLEQSDAGNFLYGNLPTVRLSGTVEVTNEEDFLLIQDGAFVLGGPGAYVGVSPWLGEYFNYPNVQGLFNELQPGETIVEPFHFELPTIDRKTNEPFEGPYFISVGFRPLNYLARIKFYVKEGMLTYWTADGRVEPLEQGSHQVLTIPAEATAVDLRGVYSVNTVFTVDPSEANPNCLYFLNGLDYVRGLEDTNWVRDYEATSLNLTDGYAFSTPVPFKARRVQYMLKPRREDGTDDPTGSAAYSETLVLPFAAEQVLRYDINDGLDTDFSSDNLSVCRFMGEEGTDGVRFERITEGPLQAYEPYLLGNLSPSRLLFFAENTEIPSTRPAVAPGESVSFVGSTTGMDITAGDYYLWHRDNENFYLATAPQVLPPFRCCMRLSGSETEPVQLLRFLLDDGATPVLPPAVTDGQARVYSLSGQLVTTVSTSGGRPDTNGLRSGLYVIDGRKVVVR